MSTYTDPNQIRLTGENQYMRLHMEAQGPMTTRASHWRILLSPRGPGHVLFLRSDVTDNERRIYTDNIAMTRWLQEEILAAGEFSDPTIPVMHAVFSRSGNSQSFWTETIDTLTEHLALTWYDFGEPLSSASRLVVYQKGRWDGQRLCAGPPSPAHPERQGGHWAAVPRAAR